jgi:hypothetical protein
MGKGEPHMKTVVAVALAAAFFVSSEAKAQSIGFGSGILCYTAEQATGIELSKYAGSVLGYWSGLNAMQLGSGNHTGYTLTGDRIGDLFDSQCKAHPTWTIQDAVSEVYRLTANAGM